MNRVILHCDMNNFYASVECALNPELKGKPIAVCGDAEERHGIVLAKNYIASGYGIKTAETVFSAKRKCPELVTVRPHFDIYMRYSRLAREIYTRYTPLIEPFGLDECWLDLTGRALNEGEGVALANEIKNTVKRELGLTLSIGVSFNKVFAKLGSDMKKPDAVTLIPQKDFLSVIGGLSASELIGIGGSTGARLNVYGIEIIAELASFSKNMLNQMFGKCGEQIWKYANGLDDSPVTLRDTEAIDKSAGNGITAPCDLENGDEVWKVMLELSEEVGHRLVLYGKRAAGVVIQIKDNALNVKQWQCQLECPTQSAYEIAKRAFRLFSESYSWDKPVRAVTVRAINLVYEGEPSQISMFSSDGEKENQRSEKIDKSLDDIRARFGSDIIKNAAVLENGKIPKEKTPSVLPGGIRK
ncbi:MAG: DNA polymerase IV [Clostridia bacterium]|nr:DNA polymerase IV [Clostridia bacterium]